MNKTLLQNLYTNASGKYLKFKSRFAKAVQNGRFYKLSKRKQSSLISRLKKLYERLKSLQTQLRLAGAGAALALTLSVSNPVQAQSSLGPFVRNDASNPLPPPFFIGRPRLAVVDIDKDGDLDIFAGNQNGDIEFFRNSAGPDTVKRFTEVTGSSNPLGSINKGADAAPAFVDVDGDLDFDMLLGTGDTLPGAGGNTFFFRNTGSGTNPVFTEQTGVNNPFDGITGTTSKYGIQEAIPVFVDIDGDSDKDLFIGSSYTSDYFGPHDAVKFYENTSGNFALASHYLTSYLANFNSAALTFADIDASGDLDAIVSDGGSLRCFVRYPPGEFREQTGPWNPVTRTGNPMNYTYFQNGSAVLADFDGDGDLDLVVGQAYNSNVSVRYFQNTDGAFTFENRDGLNISPLGGVDVGSEATPVFTDLDNDGDLDAVLGTKYSNRLSVLINKNGEFYADPSHSLVNILASAPYSFTLDVTPVFADIDDDGDQDLFAGRDYGTAFFRNDNGTFVYQTSPFNGVSFQNVTLALIDVDNDGDLDALVGHYTYYPLDSGVDYFENTGTASVPNFVSATAPAPFDARGFERDPNIFAVDLDHDGDTDLVVSETYFSVSLNSDATRTWFFENNGNGTFGNPSAPIIIGNTAESFTSYADDDGDGDLDAFIGNGSKYLGAQDGQVFFFENTNPPPVTNANTIDLNVVGGQPTIIAPLLTISDNDTDDIVVATITISDFVPGAEELGFTPAAGIVGTFDDQAGVLTFIGRASSATYESLLRSVTFNFTGVVPGGRISSAARELNLAQTITFQVRDIDFTLTTILEVSIVAIDIAGNEIVIYNAISPNKDDNANPFFKIAAIESISPENKVTIYNRWGDIVFEVNGYNNGTKKFEGISDKGKELPTGTYFYKIELSSKTITGYLSLKR